jgi:NADH:ubiquinone oxidoreductase subunit E
MARGSKKEEEVYRRNVCCFWACGTSPVLYFDGLTIGDSGWRMHLSNQLNQYEREQVHDKRIEFLTEAWK